MESQVCTGPCGRELPLGEFYIDRGVPRKNCKQCHIAKVAETADARYERLRVERAAVAEAGVYIEVAEKKCSECKRTKPIDAFYNARGEKDGKQRACKQCKDDDQRRRRVAISARERRKREKDPEKYRLKARKYHLLKRFKLTLEQFSEMFKAQGECCASCGTTEHGGTNWHIDHDHTCCPSVSKETCGDCVKAILCHTCNVGAGMFNDDPVRLRQLADYITKTRTHQKGAINGPVSHG